MLQHQQNMLQDYVRTATYYAAIMENRADFEGKVVMDVGAGTGILSLFAAQVRRRRAFDSLPARPVARLQRLPLLFIGGGGASVPTPLQWVASEGVLRCCQLCNCSVTHVTPAAAHARARLGLE